VHIRVGAAIASVAVLTACPFGDRQSPAAIAVNESGDAVQVFVTRDGEEVLVQPVIPDGQSGRLGRGELGGEPCSRSNLVARRPDGQLVERRRPPLCYEEEWIIDGVPDSAAGASPDLSSVRR
jgi:hypothetical protein